VEEQHGSAGGSRSDLFTQPVIHNTRAALVDDAADHVVDREVGSERHWGAGLEAWSGQSIYRVRGQGLQLLHLWDWRKAPAAVRPKLHHYQ